MNHHILVTSNPTKGLESDKKISAVGYKMEKWDSNKSIQPHLLKEPRIYHPYCTPSVSYTHLDVYKRQALLK